MFKIYELDRTTKYMLVVLYIIIAAVGGSIEAYYHQFIQGNEWETLSTPLMHFLLVFFAILILLIIPILTKDKEDLLFVIGCGFLLQLIEDWSYWLFRYVVLRNWTPADGFWTPYWNVLHINFPIRLFWFIDIIIAIIFIGVWYYID